MLKIGESWVHPRDSCKTFSCTEDSDGEADIETEKEQCPEECAKVVIQMYKEEDS